MSKGYFLRGYFLRMWENVSTASYKHTRSPVRGGQKQEEKLDAGIAHKVGNVGSFPHVF